MKRILLIEDEPGLVLTLTDRLRAEGYAVETREDGPGGLAAALEPGADAILLDVMLPGLDGFTVLSRLRAAGRTTPVLMLTARGQTTDKVQGLRGGADDYLTKPFETAELLARIDALLRRGAAGGKAPETVRFGDAELNLTAASVTRAGVPVALSAKEYQLLRYLVLRPGQVVNREELLSNVWGYEASISTRTVDVHVTWLRQKVEANPAEPRHLVTVRGIGYRFDP